MNRIKILSILLTILFSIESCKKDHSNQPADPPVQLKVISFSPARAAKDSVITITGENFSTNPNENFVTINDVRATVISATNDVLKVIVPLHAGTGIVHVQVRGQGASSMTIFQYLYTVTTLAGGNLGFKDGAGNVAMFDVPVGLAVDALGNVFVADANNNRVRKVTPDGHVSTWVGDGTATYKEGKGPAAAVNGLAGVAITPNADLIIADSYNNRIRKITTTADVSTLAGNDTTGFKEGKGNAAQFANPYGVAVDAAGNIYVADTYNSSIRKIDLTGEVTTLAGNGTYGYQEGTGSAARFSFPSSLAADGAGFVYVADKNNHRIRKISPSGEVVTLAGDGTAGLKDGSGPSAKFNFPFAIALGPHGHLFVTDVASHSIREISPTGLVTTIAGNGEEGFQDGLGPDAKFRFPYGLAVDGAGNIYVGDGGNYRIRKLE